MSERFIGYSARSPSGVRSTPAYSGGTGPVGLTLSQTDVVSSPAETTIATRTTATPAPRRQRPATALRTPSRPSAASGISAVIVSAIHREGTRKAVTVSHSTRDGVHVRPAHGLGSANASETRTTATSPTAAAVTRG